MRAYSEWLEWKDKKLLVFRSSSKRGTRLLRRSVDVSSVAIKKTMFSKTSSGSDMGRSKLKWEGRKRLISNPITALVLFNTPTVRTAPASASIVIDRPLALATARTRDSCSLLAPKPREPQIPRPAGSHPAQLADRHHRHRRETP